MEPYRGFGFVFYPRLHLPPEAWVLRDDAAEAVRAVPVRVCRGADHVHVQLHRLCDPVSVRPLALLPTLSHLGGKLNKHGFLLYQMQ